MRSIIALPNLLTLANAFCGFLAISKGIDAMAIGREDVSLFYAKMENACWLVFLGMIFDALDGRVARMTGGTSGFGKQLDSFSDFLTFGCAPALLAKVLLEFEAPLRAYTGNARLHFLAAAAFALMALLRLARFNLETEPDAEAHKSFNGLPSPAAAGAVASTILFYLVLRSPELEKVEGTLTPFGRALSQLPELDITVPWWSLPCLAMLLPVLGFLMVSQVRYPHAAAVLTRRGTFFTLVYMVFGSFLFFAAPIPILFLAFHTYVLSGVVRTALARRQALLARRAAKTARAP